MTAALFRIYDWLVNALAFVAGVIVVVTFLSVIYDAMLRNVGLHPTVWVIPASEYGLLYVTLFAAPWLLRTNRIIMVESLRQYMSLRMRRVSEVIIYAGCAIICVIITWFAMDQVIDTWRRGDVEQRGIPMPFWLAYAPFVISFALMGIEFVRLLVTGKSIYPLSSSHKETAGEKP